MIGDIDAHKVEIFIGLFVFLEVGCRSREVFVLLLQATLSKRVSEGVLLLLDFLDFLRVLEKSLILPTHLLIMAAI